VAGKILYVELVLDHEDDPEALMRGADIVESEVEKVEAAGNVGGEGKSKGKEINKTNFKRQLLQHVQSITIRSHQCPRTKSGRIALTKAARLMTGLKRAILVPESDFMATHPLCQRESGCSLVAGIKCKSLTVHNIQVDGTDDGPLELFTTVLKKVQHATLIIPPTQFYMEIRGGMAHLSGQPEDLSYATQHLESVRLIVAISEDEMMMQSMDFPTALTTIEPVQEFLAKFINLNTTKIEIYLFNNFDNTLELPRFRLELEVKIKKHYDDSIKYLTENNKLKPEYTNWLANYQVFGLEDYFAIPRLYYELDDFMMDEWDFELRVRNKARYEAMKKEMEQAMAEDEEVSYDFPVCMGSKADEQWSTDPGSDDEADEGDEVLEDKEVPTATSGQEDKKGNLE
jgi:hypothetical protein